MSLLESATVAFSRPIMHETCFKICSKHLEAIEVLYVNIGKY